MSTYALRSEHTCGCHEYLADALDEEGFIMSTPQGMQEAQLATTAAGATTAVSGATTTVARAVTPAARPPTTPPTAVATPADAVTAMAMVIPAHELVMKACAPRDEGMCIL